jgi:hypothetical protein
MYTIEEKVHYGHPLNEQELVALLAASSGAEAAYADIRAAVDAISNGLTNLNQALETLQNAVRIGGAA